MQAIKSFHQKALELLPGIQISIYNRSAYTLNSTFNATYVQQIQELLSKKHTIQRQSEDQNLRKLAETAGLSDIYAQDYKGFFKDIKDCIYLNGEKYRPQDISPKIILSFVNLKNELLAFLGWSFYILERLTILYSMFNFLGFFPLD